MTTPIADLAVVTPSDSDHVVIEQGGNARKSLVSALRGRTQTYTGGEGYILKVDGDELDPDVESRNFNISVADNPGANGVGVRGNSSVQLGWNLSPSNTREDATDACFGLTFEQHFVQGGSTGFEFHLQGVDTTGASFRPMTFFLPKNGSPATMGLKVSTLTAYKTTTGAQQLLWNFDTGVFDMGGSVLFFTTNNVAVFRQRNAAGTDYKNLPYYGSDNFLVLPERTRCTGSTISTATVAVASLPSAVTSGAGARAFVVDANATTFASVVAGGGANGVPVYSDGTNWRIG